MYKSIILNLVAGLAAALPAAETVGPSGHEVQVVEATYAGSGCPARSVAQMLSSDLTTLSLSYDSFVAESGRGIAASKNRRNCVLTVKLRYPQGWQWSVFKADYMGYAQIPADNKGVCKTTYTFPGVSGQMSSTLVLPPGFADSYRKTDVMDVVSTVWSPCGKEGMLSINSEVRLMPGVSPAQMTVDTSSLKFTQIHYMQWQRC